MISEHEARFTPTAEGNPRNLKIAGDVAEIRIEGVLTQKPDFWSWYFGGGNTTYEQIQQAVAICAADPSIKKVLFHVNSPGGHVDGLFDTFGAIRALNKPKSVRAAKACSAAYGLAAVIGKIEATNSAVEIGSVGVAVDARLDEDAVAITSTDSPDKRPDLSTEEGKAVIRAYLDSLYDLFVAAISNGRNVSVETIKEKFGRGASLVAVDAKKRGMIDKILEPAIRAVNPSTEPAEPDPISAEAESSAGEPSPMNLEAFKAQHPELYKQIVETASKETLEAERDRVNAHLTAGEESGDLKTAFESIRSGAAMTMTLTTKYLMAAKNRSDTTTRQHESNAAEAALGAPAAPAGAVAQDLGDQVAAVMAQERGKKL